MPYATEGDGEGRQIYANYTARPKVAGHKGSAATTTAAHLQNFSPGQIDGAGNDLIQLDARAVGLVLGGKRERQRAMRGTMAIIHEGPPAVGILTSQELVPTAPQQAAHRRNSVEGDCDAG